MSSRRVWVVGASRGVGEALVRELVVHPAEVAISARDEARLDALHRELGDRIRVVRSIDLAEPRSAEAAARDVIAGLGGLDALVVTAATIEPIAGVAHVSEDALTRAFAVNVVSPLALVRAALPALRESPDGVVLLLSSGAALAPVRGWLAYCASKAALNAAIGVLALELEGNERRVRLHGVYPGALDTAMQRTIRERGRDAMGEATWQRYRETVLRPPARAARALAAIVEGGDAVASLPLLVHVEDVVRATDGRQ